MLLIDVFRNILYRFTFFPARRRRKMTYMPWNLYFSPIFLFAFPFGCLGRQDKTYTELGVCYNLIMRYIILRIWAWKFHSIVENLIWYFSFPSLFFIFFLHEKKNTTRENRKKTRSRESFTSRRWDLVGNCISISFGFFSSYERFILASLWRGKKVMNFSSPGNCFFRAISFHRISFHSS